jgi:ribosomal protein L11 methyltransferase
MAEARLVRHAVRVPVADAETVLAALLDTFPDGLEEDRVGDLVELAGYLPAGVEPRLPAGLTAVAAPVEPGWREAWRAFHRPVRVGRFWVGPPWCEPDEDAEAVVIEPGAAFGTGAHGSTQAIAALLLEEPVGGSLLDLGCGSGVLSILAARLGFAPVTAVDLDDLAVSAARENAERNGVDIDVFAADALRDALPAADLAVANLERRLLEPLLRRRGELPRRVLVSGLLGAEAEALDRGGWRVAARADADGWSALALDAP